MKSLLLCALIMVGTSYSQAQEGSSALQFGREETEAPARGLLPFIALGGGYTGYENVQEVEGAPATIKLLGSYYLESPWVMDLGYGVNNQQFTNTNAVSTSRTEGALELAARYRFDSRWQLGVIANQFFDQGDAYSADQADAQFAGVQLLREFNMSPSWLGRIGARAQSLTNNTDGLVMMYLVDLQIGWNPGAYKPSTKSVGDTAATEDTVREAMDEDMEVAAPSRPVAMEEPTPILKELSYAALAGGTAIQFRTAQTGIDKKDQERLAKVAQVLNDNPDLVERVEVRGYTDSTGSSEINERISQQRAEQVSSILKKNGLSDVVAVGKGSSDGTGIMSQDRRAELIFIGVKDEEALRDALSQIE